MTQVQKPTDEQASAGALRGPLDGVRVLDLTNMLSGPYCTRLLADLGAEVIKVEPLHGDHNRGRRPVRDGHSSFFGHLNCGKKSVVLNLKSEAGLAAALSIARQSDVVVENWRPGVAERLGLGYDAVRALRANVVYCSISGFGQTGPASRRPAYAPIIHAASGFDLAQVEYQGGGKPQNTATYTADVFGGMSAFAAIQAALFHRERSGLGQYIDVALLDGMLNILVAESQEWQSPANAASRVYPPLRTRDGFIVIAPTSQKNFEGLVQVIEREEWLTDPRFVSTVSREKNWAEMMSLIEEWTCRHGSDECERRLAARGVPCTRYLTVQEAMASEQVRARRAVTQVQDAVGEYLVPNAPFQMPGLHAAPRRDVPTLGAHTESVLAELAGLSAQQARACQVAS